VRPLSNTRLTLSSDIVTHDLSTAVRHDTDVSLLLRLRDVLDRCERVNDAAELATAAGTAVERHRVSARWTAVIRSDGTWQ